MNKKLFFIIIISFSFVFLFNNAIAVDTANCSMSISNQRLGAGENAVVDVQCSSNVEVSIHTFSDYQATCELESTATACVNVFNNWNCELTSPISSPQNLVNGAFCSDSAALTPRKICFYAEIRNADNGNLITNVGGNCNYGFGTDFAVYEAPRIDLQQQSSKQTGTQFNFFVDAAMFYGFRSGDAIQIDTDCARNGLNCDYSQFEPEILIDGFALPDNHQLTDYLIPYTYTSSCSGGWCYVALKIVDGQGNSRFAQLDGGIFVQDNGVQCAAGTACVTNQGCTGICAANNIACNDNPNDNCPVVPGGCQDIDGDGYQAAFCGGNDCDDSRNYINPAQLEVCGDSFDNDCDGTANEGCEQIITCEDPCTVLQNGVWIPGTCDTINGVSQCRAVVGGFPQQPSSPADGVSCTAYSNGFPVNGTFLTGICFANETNSPVNDECFYSQLGNYQCNGSSLMQCQNSSTFDFVHEYISPLNEEYKWKLVENCESQCVDAGANSYCEENLILTASCIDSTTYSFSNGTSCKDKFGDHSASCSLIDGTALVDYRCNNSGLCEPTQVSCGSGTICSETQGLTSSSASCQSIPCNAGTIGPNTQLVCGASYSGAQIAALYTNDKIFSGICSNLAKSKAADWVYISKRLSNQLAAGSFDDSVSLLFAMIRSARNQSINQGNPASNCAAGIHFSFEDFVNGKADGKCVDWAGVMFVEARTIGVPYDRLQVDGFQLSRPVKIYSAADEHAALFYQSDSGVWRVFDLTSSCAGEYKSLSSWHNACGATKTDCSNCREQKSNDAGYSNFSASDAGSACSAVLQCENNFCPNGTQVGQCIPDSPPYKCGATIFPQSDVAQCGCPIAGQGQTVRQDPYNLGCLCDAPLKQVGNSQAFCTDSIYDGLLDGKQYYYISYDCAGADHKPNTSDDISCGTGFSCVNGKKGAYPFGVCVSD